MSESEKKEILYDGEFYDVTQWIKRHPGGRIIEMYTQTGEDSTFPIQQFHNRANEKVAGIMKSLKRRPASIQEIHELSRMRTTDDKKVNASFVKLHKEFEAEGLFRPDLLHVVMRITELLTLLSVGIFLLLTTEGVLSLVGLFSLALFQGRCGWLMHEGGHNSLTGFPKIDHIIQTIFYGFGNGMSGSWWNSQHNRHHAMPQRLQRDVDLETLPFLAFNKAVVKDGKKGNLFIRHQATLFLAIDTFLVAFYWKAYLHPRAALMKRKWSELLFMALHYLIPYYVGFTPYLISVWLASVYIFGNFSLSHTHLPVTSGPVHWAEFAFIHTANVKSSFLVDWWMGYLNFQIEHHLFPTMPQFRHKLIAPRVRKFAEENGFKYITYSYTTAVEKTFKNLHHVAQELRH